jgi:diamine N-acetyltransferase
MKIELSPLTRDNWRECIRLELAPGQERLVASNVASIAESRFEPHYEPRAIYADGEMVGFLMYCPDLEAEEQGLFWLFRLMTDRRRQGQGIGRQAIDLALEEIAVAGGRRVKICHVPENEVASRLYQRLGFVPTGEIEDGEVILAIDLEMRPGPDRGAAGSRTGT